MHKGSDMRLVGYSRTILAFQCLALLMFAVLLLLKAFNTLEWRMEHDTPLLHYVAFLMDEHDLIPYRDVFETSMPGTFAFHYSIGKLFGYSDFAFRCVDLTLLGAMLAATFIFMSRFGRLPAMWAVVLFGLVYFWLGQSMSLQRDYVGVIPVVFSLLLIPGRDDTAVRLRRFAIVGLLFGLSALIKPHLAIGLPVAFGTLVALRWNSARNPFADLVRCAAVCVTSFVVPLMVAMAWLAAHSALGPFSEMFCDYLPLHSALTGSHENISPPRRIFYLARHGLQFGGYGALLLCSLVGFHRVLTHASDKTKSVPVVALLLYTAIYALYPVLAGKFWNYHYLPLAYFCSISAGLCLFAWPELAGSRLVARLREALVLMFFLVAVTLQLNLPMYVLSTARELGSGSEEHAPAGGRADEIASWLRGRLQPGDRVQPFDWTGGGIHAMLLAEARLATRFLYGYHFYHHVSSPVVQRLRTSFIGQLRAASPRFIVEVHEDKPWVSGIDSTDEFPEWQQFLDDHYAPAFEGDGYSIYELVSCVRSSSPNSQVLQLRMASQ